MGLVYISASVEAIVSGHLERDQQLREICELLQREVPYYDWVGFYLVDPNVPGYLMLGPYVGAPTEHVRIAFGQGICGQAAATEQTFVIQDVTQEANYLSCSPHVRSEIVVPILRGGLVIGELDIDSHTPAPFTQADNALLESICRAVSKIL